MDKFEILPATEKDMRFFYPQGQKTTCRAFVARIGGRNVAIAGVQNAKSCFMIFSRVAEDANLPKITIWRIALAMWTSIKALGYPVLYAVANDKIERAPLFIARFGLQYQGKTDLGEIFRWAIR